MRSFFFCLTLLACVACQPAKTDSEGSSDNAASSQSLLQELKTVATGACSRTSDCYSAAIGARACGGPEDYLYFSKWDSASQIMDLVYSYNKAREKDISGTVGTCEYRMPPAVVCSSNKCIKQSSSSDGEGTSLKVVSGVLTLAASNIADAASMTLKVQNNSTVYYVRISQLDFTTRTKLETYRKTNASVKLSVRIFGLTTEAQACEFMYAPCTTRVSVFDVRALRILSIQ